MVRGGRITSLGAPPSGIKTQLATATADLRLTIYNVDVPGCSLSLEAGTWLIIATFCVRAIAHDARVYFFGRLDVGGVAEDIDLWLWHTATDDVRNATQVWFVTLTETTTVKLQGAKGGADAGVYDIVWGFAGGKRTVIAALG